MAGPWQKRLTGGCQCGAVRYVLTAKPEEACVCHCRMCQKASGQPFMAFAKSAPGALTWTRVTPATFRSSSSVVRGFCQACGTPLAFRYEDNAPYIMICTLDDPSAVVPTYQCGVESEVGWCGSLFLMERHETEEDDPDKAAQFVNYQHPDRDT